MSDLPRSARDQLAPSALNSRSSGAQSGSTGASSSFCSIGARFVLLPELDQRLGEEEQRRRCCSGCRSATCAGAPPTSCRCRRTVPAPCKYQRPSARSAEPCWNAGSSRSTVSSASLMSPRYFRPWRRPNDSASAPMLAAIQKCPSGLFGATRDRRAAGRDARLEIRLARLLVGVAAEPVARARELPGRFEVLRILREPLGPDAFGLLRAGDVLALSVERVGIGGLRRGRRWRNRETRRATSSAEREHRVRDVTGPADPALQAAREQAPAQERAHRHRRQRHGEQQPGRPVEQQADAPAGRRASRRAARWARRAAATAGSGTAPHSRRPP